MIIISSVFSGIILSENNFPAPAECDDVNAVTFDDGDFSFASVDLSEKDHADGELEIAEIKGNKGTFD